jgi:hypothetical protein
VVLEEHGPRVLCRSPKALEVSEVIAAIEHARPVGDNAAPRMVRG